jgi:hypothetical protein
MKKARFGYQMDDDEEQDVLSDNSKEANEREDVVYEFEGYDVEINTKVALLPKATSKP